MASDGDYILRLNSRDENIGRNLYLVRISTLLRARQKDLNMDSDLQMLIGHSFTVQH